MGTVFYHTPTGGDLAFLLLDKIFGFPNLFGSCADPGIACPPLLPMEAAYQPPWPTNFHTGLHVLFNFYNLGIACVGLIIFLYLCVSVLGETAQTGVPFGHRFNKAWAIPRMMLAVSMLTPLDSGMNARSF